MKNIDLSWKEYQVNGRLVETNMKALCAKVTAVSENSSYQVHCNDDITDEEIQDIQDLWDAITDESEEATTFLSRDAQEAARAAKAASGKAKLIALGLTEDEANALLG